MPTEPRADDLAALVEECRQRHRPWNTTTYLRDFCAECKTGYPCLTTRLADALETAQKELDTRRSQDEGNQRDAELAVKWLAERDAARSDLAALRPAVEAAREWRDVIGGKLTVPPQAYLDAECRLASAVDALATRGTPE